MAQKRTAKRPNPQDTTLRNIRAAKARINGVAKRLAQLEDVLPDEIGRLKTRVKALEERVTGRGRQETTMRRTITTTILLAAVSGAALAAESGRALDGKSATYNAPAATVYAAALRTAATRGAVTFADPAAGVITARIGKPLLSISIVPVSATASRVQVRRQGFNGVIKPDRGIKPYLAALTAALQQAGDESSH